MTQWNVVWISFSFLMLGIIGCERPSNEIDYRGEKIKLTKAYANYHDYKNDPENIHPSETERVQRLVLNAPIGKTYNGRLEAAKAIGQIAFPGYGSGGFIEQSQADGSVLMGFSVEVPRASKERYIVFQGKESVYTILSRFRRSGQIRLEVIFPFSAHLLRFRPFERSTALERFERLERYCRRFPCLIITMSL